MRAIALLIAAVALVGCGHATKVRPTSRGAVAIDATLGGPVGQVEGQTIPLPLITVGASYGIADRFDLDAHAHVTSALFGVAGLDVGSTFLALEQDGALPAAAGTLRLYGFSDLQAFRAYAELTPSVSWMFGDVLGTYLSGTAFVQFAGGLPLLSASTGLLARFGGTQLQLEARWYQPGAVSTNLPTRWQGIGGYGALGVMLAFQQEFGGTR